MALRPHTATIHGTTERAETWRRIFGTDTVEVRSPLETPMILDGLGEQACFIVAVDKLTPEQLDRAVDHLATQFNVAPDEVRAELLERGIPLLAADVTVCMDMRYFL